MCAFCFTIFRFLSNPWVIFFNWGSRNILTNNKYAVSVLWTLDSLMIYRREFIVGSESSNLLNATNLDYINLNPCL